MFLSKNLWPVHSALSSPTDPTPVVSAGEEHKKRDQPSYSSFRLGHPGNERSPLPRLCHPHLAQLQRGRGGSELIWPVQVSRVSQTCYWQVVVQPSSSKFPNRGDSKRFTLKLAKVAKLQGVSVPNSERTYDSGSNIAIEWKTHWAWS